MIQLPFYSFNKNSLLVQCFKSACIYYIPQNLVVIGAFLFYQHKKSKGTDGKPSRVTNCKETINNFLVGKNLNRDEVNIQKKKNIYYISLIR
ncbi:hypothetical protein HEP_00241100 [Hepatocystis sp. ex Piliocolobus tephrosceles]|nr:hypothetical protein HEP_00241100 [Hepatocystis sp. ex Piliocolobus tephrosceles]